MAKTVKSENPSRLLHHLSSIFKMFKLILTLALFAVAYGQYDEFTPYEEGAGGEPTEVTNDLGDGVAVTSGSCSNACGMTKIKLEIEVPSGGCGGGPIAPPEDLCLGSKNSKKISKATLGVLHRNPDYSFSVLKDLKIIDFMYSCIKYHDFVDNIKNNEFGYVGFPRLKKLVTKYKVCEKVCKVYATLRKALREHASQSQVYVEANAYGQDVVKVYGDLIILSEALPKVLQAFEEDPTLAGAEFDSNSTLIFDANLLDVWSGKFISLKAVDFILVGDYMIDISAPTGSY